MRATQRSLESIWTKTLLIVLFCYALLGKGFAYTYCGELLLVLGVCVLLRSRRVMVLFSDPTLLLWALFAFWGLCRTVPFIQHYGFDALRDAVLWGYGVCALLIVAFVGNSEQISVALNTYRRFMRWYLPILPGMLIITSSFHSITPKLPWASDVPIVDLKAGDAGVQLAGGALFLLLFSAQVNNRMKGNISFNKLLMFVSWVAAALLVMIITRGGFAAIVVPLTIVSLIKLRNIGWRVGLYALTGLILALSVLQLNLFTIHIKGHDFSPEDIVSVAGSIVSGSDSAAGHAGTREWRLDWWSRIINYTFFGPYFWTGKGFGVNLAIDDFSSLGTGQDTLLRSPHNGNMTVLARMGVPGFVLWVGLNLTFCVRLLRTYRVSVRSGSHFWSNLSLWILLFWLAAIINASFDVDIEGPQGGIWFWSLVGFGVAAIRVQACEARNLADRAHRQLAERASSEYLLTQA